ncbi:MAG: iron-containing alcohol dehydrogenase [Gammaproteobacteria bacterium]|nr:iron-containing alcohol dehydrogenase [Gammaproteobacteria bacterium]
MTLSGNWNYPTTVKAGAGRAAELPAHCRNLGVARPLLITDPGLAELAMTQGLLDRCQDAGLGVDIFSAIKSNPTERNVVDAVAALRQGRHDGVIAFGGGSALDAAKAAALLAGQDRPLFDYEDVGDNWTRVDAARMLPVIAIPTTAGTGSEVGRAAVITDEAAKTKRLIFHPKMLPALVILDPELTTGLPPKLTAATGMDALSHCLEAYCAPGFHPLADGVALEGMRLVKNHLPIAYREGGNLEARLMMLAASSMGATAFQKGLGAMHALAHPLGARYDAHHGTLNAVLMPYVLTANQGAIAERLCHLARVLALPEIQPGAVVTWVLALREELGIPHTLATLGIGEDCLDWIGEAAVQDPSAGGNPIAFDAGQYRELARRAINGLL